MNNQMMRTPGKAPKAAKSPKSIEYLANGEPVTLSVATVRNYLVSGNKTKVTDQEIVMFINMCKYAGLNPWLREAYCIKYGNEPATMVTGKAAFEKRADNCPNYDGSAAGIIVYDPEAGTADYRNGSFKLPGEEIIGGWAEVYRKDREHPTRIEVGFDEYVGRKSDGTINGQWRTKPGTMIRKVALVQALREAFPNSFGGMYDAAEMGVDDTALEFAPVQQPTNDQLIQDHEPHGMDPAVVAEMGSVVTEAVPQEYRNDVETPITNGQVSLDDL